MDFMKLAAERYSVRKFDGRKLEKEVLDKILEAGHVAPTGCNNQPQRILVITGDDALEKIKKCTKYHFDAPCVMLICYNKRECWTRRYDGAICGIVDASIVTTHMMLEAFELGIGSTWVMSFDPAAIRTEFNVPEDYEPVALLPMGYPAPDAEPFHLHAQFRPID
ncbi:MAG: nitroreductase family protein, partial [Clostridia bacterium]|nr:nitroreductase family protein [Clostridia bacterium]